MISKEFKFLIDGQNISKVHKEREARIVAISRGLDWEAAGFIRTPEDVQRTINSTIDDQLCRLVRYLSIPYPDVGLIQHWNDVPPEDQRPMEDALAESRINENHPDGIINFSPGYLKSVVSGEMGIPISIIALKALVGHEAYHLWQFKETPDELHADLDISMGPKATVPWVQTSSEINAIEFQRYWLENWMNHPPVKQI